ncbi:MULTISPECIES: hypothetical protein [Corynebacterium]|uniref:hypothetical protein n=1 Tax=Corynebacterium TaxID=1716 RepID=UPI00143AAC9E|nr:MULTISPECIES: hypothetical protein [Corynebacterium]MCT1548093.1 hypothetical protein [Corynebacterium amycolatum]
MSTSQGLGGQCLVPAAPRELAGSAEKLTELGGEPGVELAEPGVPGTVPRVTD